MRQPRHPKLRVLVAVPSDAERAGLRLMIEADRGFQIVAETFDGRGALSLAQKHEPDIALIDSAISDVPALGLIHFLTGRSPGTQILLYTERCNRDWLDVALREGVRGFVLKSQVSTRLLQALRALADHRPYWEDAVDDDLLDELLESEDRGLQMFLSSREWQILQMSAQDQTTAEIADTLGVSPKTVERHRASVRRKLGFRRRTDLVRYAEEHRLRD